MSQADGSTCSTPQRSGSGEDSDSDCENENIRPRGLTGLQNLGNTCYLNSALQSLSNCPPLTRYFLDCPQLIRPEKPPMLSRSYLKLMTELWHKKRPSYVVPSGVVTGIKAVHPMFRGYTQQDAQEFLRCLMDQLHEELKVPFSDESESEDEDDGGGGDDDDGSNNASSNTITKHKNATADNVNRRSSRDSMSSQSDYETCDSGLSSERSSNGGRDNGSSDENNSDTNEASKLTKTERSRKSSLPSPVPSENTDSVANTKEMKETANLLEKISESDGQNRRQPSRMKAVMEGGDSREQGSSAYISNPVKDDGASPTSTTPTLVQPQQTRPKSPLGLTTKPRRKKNTRFESIISQTFDGKILSSVRCLNCNTVSTTKETFQDLSLPIPSKDHLHMLHAGYLPAGGVVPPKGGTCGEVHQGWLAWMYSWMKSWFIGPTITLQDCLLAFFSADELKGDNMYSCEKCKKLRNGLKYSKVLKLPEILSIHLKRFRHEFYSSKIGTYISFPLEGLDMEPYLHRGSVNDSKFHKACKDEVTLYDLVAIICHHGTAGGGHYTAYCLNHLNDQWYEFDDQYVTEVDVSQVQNCEAYVLFYRKSNKAIDNVRQKVKDLELSEISILRFFISKQWLSRFDTFAEPGPITNKDFLCKHGGVPPGKVNLIHDLYVEISQSTWELLYSRFGGGPVCNHLYTCKTCQSELEKLRQRQRTEKDMFIQLNDEFREEEHSATVYAISMAWFKEWEAFVKEKTDIPPGPIENSRIIMPKNPQPTLRLTSDYGQLSKEMWQFLHQIYGGGPEVIIRQSTGTSVKPTSSSPTLPQIQQGHGGALQPAVSSSSLSSSPSAAALSPNSSNTSAIGQSSSSVVTSFETTASQTTSYSSVSTSTSTHPPSSCTSMSCTPSTSVSRNDDLKEMADNSSLSSTDVAKVESSAEVPRAQSSLNICNKENTQPAELVPSTLDSSSETAAAGVKLVGSIPEYDQTSSPQKSVKPAESRSAPNILLNGTLDAPNRAKLMNSSAPSALLVALNETKDKNTDRKSPAGFLPNQPLSSPENISVSSVAKSEINKKFNSPASMRKSTATSNDSLPDSGFSTDHSCNDLHSILTDSTRSLTAAELGKPETNTSFNSIESDKQVTSLKASSPSTDLSEPFIAAA
ncbi:unnamed protein product, partial [Lymnaea stagnalis]